jgi:hypothetical protein
LLLPCPMLTVSWQPYDSITPQHVGYNLSDFGGPDDGAADWLAYVMQYPAQWHPHVEAVRQSILDQGIWAGGDWHQESAHGVPMLSDGHFFCFSWRGWGGLLAAVWSSELGEHFTYMDFYMNGRLPERPTRFSAAN